MRFTAWCFAGFLLVALIGTAEAQRLAPGSSESTAVSGYSGRTDSLNNCKVCHSAVFCPTGKVAFGVVVEELRGFHEYAWRPQVEREHRIAAEQKIRAEAPRLSRREHHPALRDYALELSQRSEKALALAHQHRRALGPHGR